MAIFLVFAVFAMFGIFRSDVMIIFLVLSSVCHAGYVVSC